MDKKKKCRHKNHRNRLREAYIANQTSLADVKLLEMVLFYVIPRYDTSGMAQDLLEKFGSLSGVFTAEKDELLQIEGIGGKAADFLVLCGAVLNKIFDSFHSDFELDCHAMAQLYISWELCGERDGTELLIYVNSENLIIGSEKISGNSTQGKTFETFLKTEIDSFNPDKIIVAVKREMSKLKETDKDVETVKVLNGICTETKLSGFEYYIANKKTSLPLYEKIIKCGKPLFEK